MFTDSTSVVKPGIPVSRWTSASGRGFFAVHCETYQNLPGHRAPADVNMPQKPLAGGLVVDADPVLVYIINYCILRGVDLLGENAAAGVFHHVVGARPVESGVGASFFTATGYCALLR